MDVTELMLNDLVLFDNRVCKIVATNAYRGCVELIDTSDEDNEVIGKYAKHIEPIPLTAEILEKNGFAVNSMIARIWRDYIVEYYFFENSVSIKNGINTLYKKCTYIHELQHALRLCGLNELADNFKVA